MQRTSDECTAVFHTNFIDKICHRVKIITKRKNSLLLHFFVWHFTVVRIFVQAVLCHLHFAEFFIFGIEIFIYIEYVECAP